MAISEERENYIEAAVEIVMDKAQEEAEPDKMSQEEALDFYRMISGECDTWIDNIKRDIGITT